MTYDQNNIFAKIIRGQVPSSKVFEDDKILAFHDISKGAPTHILVIPKGEYVDYSDFTSKAAPEEISYFFKKVDEIAKNNTNSGFRLIMNIGSNAHQTVPHFHIHILAGKKLGPLLSSDIPNLIQNT